MKISIYIKKIVIYCFGLFIMALGVSLSKASNLGVSPVNSIPCAVSNILKIDMGICTTAVFIIFILIQIIILKKEFKVINLLQILCSFLFGFFVSVTNYFCEAILTANPNYFVSLIYLFISIVLVAFGILLYLKADIISLPGEGVMQAVSYKYKIKMSTAKIIFDWTMVGIATIILLIFLQELNGVREGTVIAAFAVGLFLKLFEKLFSNQLSDFIYGAVASD